MLVFVFLPGAGILVYVLFGRDRKAFARQSRLLRQDLEANAKPLLASLPSRQDAEIARLKSHSTSVVRAGVRVSYTRRGTSTHKKRLSEELEAAFECDLSHCTEFDAAQHQKRNIARRFRDSVARLLSPLL
jgi:cardiolipin synthase